jgi:hypothetical protein
MLAVYSCRKWLVNWLYLVAGAHLLVGLAMSWMSSAPLFAQYHQEILGVFGVAVSQAEGLALQQWWLALFGATLQAFALLFLLLVYYAGRFRQAKAWLWLALVILIWAPQDMLISIRQGIWVHLWVDLAAVVAIVPPLVGLWYLDRKGRGSN